MADETLGPAGPASLRGPSVGFRQAPGRCPSFGHSYGG
jgi:hypothetical protein